MSDTVWDIEQRAQAGQPLIDLSTWTTDQRRQADVMVALDVWSSRTCGAWVEDGFAAFKTDAEFAQDMMLDLACDCSEEHALRLDLPCLFVDEYRDSRFLRPEAYDRINSLLNRVDRRYGGPLSTPKPFTIEPPFGRPIDAMRFEGVAGFVVAQRRYVDAGLKVNGVETWTLVGTAPRPGHTRISTLVIGERSGEVVALIMPMHYRDADGGVTINKFPPAAPPAQPTTTDGGRGDDRR